jgi:hypothetical protein
MNMRQSRRTKAHASARQQQAYAYSEHMHAQAALDAECFTDDGDDTPRTCSACEGEVMWNGWSFECPHCGGTGREG